MGEQLVHHTIPSLNVSVTCPRFPPNDYPVCRGKNASFDCQLAKDTPGQGKSRNVARAASSDNVGFSSQVATDLFLIDHVDGCAQGSGNGFSHLSFLFVAIMRDRDG